MVEVSDGPQSPDQQALRQRAQRLAGELDRLESRHRKICQAFRGAVSALASMVAAEQTMPQVAVALLEIKEASAANPLEAETLDKAVDSLKTALMGSHPDFDQPVSTAEETPPTPGDASGHVALALLEGLRLGEPEFDTHLERAIVQVKGHISAGQVRPAMGVLVDLLDHFRLAHDLERQSAQTALQEVLKELFTAESEMADLFQQTQNQISQAGQVYEDRMTWQMGRLVQDLGEARDLDTLKYSALEHIRALRDHIKAQRAQEKDTLSRTQGELTRLKDTLDTTRQRMAQVEQVSQRLSEEALTDPLTKVWNKRALTAKLSELLESGNGRGLPVSLIVFDIDRFKSINDNFGHQAGDRALKTIAQQAAASLRQQDILFRYAGDEFVIVLAKTSLVDALMVAERVRQAAENIRFTYRGSQELRVTISLGVAQTRDLDSPETLFERADQALLAAKRSGRNRVSQG